MTTPSLEELKSIACKAIDAQSTTLHQLSDTIWQHPELNFNERHAHAALTEFLATHGSFDDVERSYVVETAFKATYGDDAGGTRPHVAILCEYDALPEIGHACGHNLIAEVGVAAGLGVRAALQAAGNTIGKLTVLGTPAEEGGCGKMKLIKAGAFEGVDAAMMAHPAYFNSFRGLCTVLCIDRATVTYRGRAVHASATPWKGINALDAAVNAYVSLSTLRQQIKPTSRVHAVILNGGVKANIIPELSVMEVMIRTPTMAELDVLRKRVVNCLEAAATATGCTVEMSWSDSPMSNMIVSEPLSDLFERNAKLAHLPELSATDRKLALELSASTDMGNVSLVVPSIHPMFAIAPPNVPIHTREFATYAGDPKSQVVTLQMAKALAMTALDIYCVPGTVRLLADQFKADLEADREKSDVD